ncbi:hypothetical protein GCM10028775_35600 [Catellatospora paridis]
MLADGLPVTPDISAYDNMSGDAASADGAAPAGIATVGTGTPWRRWRPSVVAGLAVWAGGLFVYFLVTAAAWMPLGKVLAQAEPIPSTFRQLIATWYVWDTTWYLSIADSGYRHIEQSTAFFPLYPMTVRVANYLLPGDSLEAALLVGALCCLAVLILAHRLATDLIGAEDAQRTIIYLLAFPTGFFLMAGYNEAMFVALALASLYCMRRGRWWWAAMFAGFAGATRMAGIMLGAAFVYEYLRQHGFSIRELTAAARQGRLLRALRALVDRHAFAVVLVPAGVGAYMLYCRLTFGNALHFLESQKAWNRDGFTFPWTVIGDTVVHIRNFESIFHPDSIRNIANLITALGVLVLLVLALAGPWRLGAENAYLVIFAAAIILMPLSNPIRAHVVPLDSLWRFALECTVVFMVLARMGRSAAFDRLYLTTMMAVQGVMLVVFLHFNFVA